MIRWTCPRCGSTHPANQDVCVTCWPTVVPKPTPAPTELPAACVEVMRHLAAWLRDAREKLNEKRLSAHQLGVKGHGLKHVADELGHCAERLEKELEG